MGRAYRSKRYRVSLSCMGRSINLKSCQTFIYSAPNKALTLILQFQYFIRFTRKERVSHFCRRHSWENHEYTNDRNTVLTIVSANLGTTILIPYIARFL